MSEPDPQERLLTFARERHRITLKRAQGLPPPWTSDPILQAFRFCSVYRELDRVTIWIRENWRDRNRNDPDLWFAMMVARFVNWPATMEELGYPVPWEPETFLGVMDDRRSRRLKCYGGAYVIRADSGTPGRSTAAYQVAEMFDPFWARRAELRPRPDDTLCSYHMTLGQLFGLGSFMAAQVVADLKYVPPLASATDWQSFAASGPGSRRGLNRVLGRPVRAPWTEDDWRMELGRLREWFNLRWDDGDAYPALHAQDLQNCLCEFDKMERVRLGEGRPRAKFRPTQKGIP